MPIFNVCGTNYQYPNVGEKPWGAIHITWASAISSCLTSVNTQVSQIAANQFINPMLANGDMIIQDLNVPARLPIGTAGQVLKVGVSGLPEWGIVAGSGDVVGPAVAVNENIAVFNGTTGKLIKDGGITVAAILAQISASTLNYNLSASCGLFTGSNTASAPVTNLTCTLTTTGGPVVLAIIGDGQTATSSTIKLEPFLPASSVNLIITVLRGVTNIYQTWWGVSNDTAILDQQVNPSTIWTIDFLAAGTYTWTVEANVLNANDRYTILNKKLFAYELK